jgi:hypothetical protein
VKARGRKAVLSSLGYIRYPSGLIPRSEKRGPRCRSIGSGSKPWHTQGGERGRHPVGWVEWTGVAGPYLNWLMTSMM